MAISEELTGQPSNPLTSFAAVTHANRSAVRASVKASLMNAIFGRKLPDAFASFDPGGCCWKTSQATFHWASEPFSETWPRSGMMRGGIAYQLRPSAPRTFAIACSSWRGELTATPTTKANQLAPSMMKHPGCRAIAGLLPTPVASLERNALLSDAQARRANRRVHVTSVLSARGIQGRLSPQFVEWMMGFPLDWTRLDSAD